MSYWPVARWNQYVAFIIPHRCHATGRAEHFQISDFLIQLFPSIPRDRFSTLSCSHVIPKNNLLTQVVSMGPKKMDFEFKFANRGDDALVCLAALIIPRTA